MMEIRGDRYRIHYDLATTTIACEGTLLLNGLEEYQAILRFLKERIDQRSGEMTLDLRELKYLNSSGINMLARFIMYVQSKKQDSLGFIIRGKKEIYWHERVFKNLKKLLPTLVVKFD